jgi:hypothetical protein
VGISNNPEEGKKDTHTPITFNHDEVLEVPTWHSPLREWNIHLDGKQLRHNKAGHKVGWKNVPKVEDGAEVGVRLTGSPL